MIPRFNHKVGVIDVAQFAYVNALLSTPNIIHFYVFHSLFGQTLFLFTYIKDEFA